MPFALSLSEDKRVLFFHMMDPLNIEEIMALFPELNQYFNDTGDHKLHTLIDITKWNHLPPGVLKARSSPVLVHKNSGNLAVVGAHPFAQTMAETMFHLINYKRARFFNTSGEALAYLRQVISEEKQP